MLDTSNTKKVIDMLRRYSDNREIIVDNINKLDKYTTYLGVCTQTPENIYVYINYSYSENIQEACFVHEILHIILDHEGYPNIAINNLKMRNIKPEFHNTLHYLRYNFASVITHPIVFSREINLFDFNIDEYFEIQVEKKVERFNKRKPKKRSLINEIFLNQQDILVGLDYFSYPTQYKDKIIKIFKEQYPGPHKSCLSLYKKLEFTTPNECYISANKIKKHLIKYAKRKGANKINIFWDALDIVKSVTT